MEKQNNSKRQTLQNTKNCNPNTDLSILNNKSPNKNKSINNLIRCQKIYKLVPTSPEKPSISPQKIMSKSNR